MTLIAVSYRSSAQILLRGYKCKFYKDQDPFTMAEMYRGNDTFRFTLLTRDIWGTIAMANDTDSPQKELQVGLEICFGDEHYYKTKDSLYYATGKNETNTFFYEVYVPNVGASVSLRSNKNDAAFSERSKWLLAEIRKHRHTDIYLINDKNQTCQNPDDPRH